MLIRGRLLLALPAADRVAGDDVTELVRDHALDLVDVVRRLDQPRLEIDGLSGRDESVDLGIVQKDHVDAVRVEPGSDDQRPRHVLEQQLRLGVAEDGRAGVVLICWASSGLGCGHGTAAAAIMNRRAKRTTGDFIACGLPFLRLNAR